MGCTVEGGGCPIIDPAGEPEARKAMSRNGPAKMDVRAAWNSWSGDSSPEAAAEFFERVGSWMEGTAAQLSRGGTPASRLKMTREQVADRLRYHLGLVAEGETVTYVEALELARQNVIAELRSRS
jgi:plasmid stabilization system protein ParE